MDKKVAIFLNMTIPEAIGYGGKTGSVVRVTEMLKHFRKLESELEIVLQVTASVARYFQESGVEAQYRILPTRLKFSGYGGLCLKAFYLIVKSFFIFGVPSAKTKEEKIVVYASSDLFWEVIPAFVYKIRNKKIEWVQILHHIYPDWRKRPGSKSSSFFGYYLQKFSLFLIRKKANKIILMNSLIKQELLSRGFEAQRIRILSNGIDFDYYESIETGNVSYDGVFLGRMNASKGVADFIPIWKKVCEKVPAARLAVIGGAEKEEKAEFIQKIKENGLEKNIAVLGFLEDDAAFSLLKAAKVFIFPSHEEGWGIAIAQSMACGLPVVSWDLPVYREIFEDYTLQIKENDFNLFSNKVAQLLADENYRNAIGDQGKEFIQKYSWESVAKREFEIIKA